MNTVPWSNSNVCDHWLVLKKSCKCGKYIWIILVVTLLATGLVAMCRELSVFGVHKAFYTLSIMVILFLLPLSLSLSLSHTHVYERMSQWFWKLMFTIWDVEYSISSVFVIECKILSSLLFGLQKMSSYLEMIISTASGCEWKTCFVQQGWTWSLKHVMFLPRNLALVFFKPQHSLSTLQCV